MEKLEVKFKQEIEQMEQFVQKNFEKASANLEVAEEKRESLKLAIVDLQSKMNSIRKQFFKVAKDIAVMAINPPKLSHTVTQTIQPVLDYIDCLKQLYKIKTQYANAKGDVSEAKGKLNTAKIELETVQAIRKRKDG